MAGGIKDISYPVFTGKSHLIYFYSTKPLVCAVAGMLRVYIAYALHPCGNF